MRDATVISIAQEVNENLSKNTKVLHDAITANRTRVDAIENVLFSSRRRFWCIVLAMVINPGWAQRLVAEAHAEEIRKYNEAVKAARAKSKTALTVVGAGGKGLTI